MQEVEGLRPARGKDRVLPVVLRSQARPWPRAQVDLGVARKREVYILMHSHNDIGYTDIQPNIAKKQAHNVLRALELIRQTKDYPAGSRFKWNLEVLMPYEDFHAMATPEQEKQFEQAVREGNIGIDAMYANLLTGVCRAEELLRQFTFATAGPPMRGEGRFHGDQRRAGADLGRRAGAGAERREVHLRRPQREPRQHGRRPHRLRTGAMGIPAVLVAVALGP